MLSTGKVWAAWMPFLIILERAKLDLLTSAHQCTHPSVSVSRSLLMILECQCLVDKPHLSLVTTPALVFQYFYLIFVLRVSKNPALPSARKKLIAVIFRVLPPNFEGLDNRLTSRLRSGAWRTSAERREACTYEHQ